MNPFSIYSQIADIYLADQFKKKPREETKKLRINSINLSKKALEVKAGNYYDEKSGMRVNVSVEDEKLKIDVFGQSFLLSPVSKTSFQTLEGAFDISLNFSAETRAKPQKAMLTMRGKEEIYLVKVTEELSLTPGQLKEYTGEYNSDELQTTFRLMIEKGALVFKQSYKQRNVPKSSLKAMAKDKFTVENWSIEFLPNKRKDITGFIIGTGGLEKIEFIKKLVKQ